MCSDRGALDDGHRGVRNMYSGVNNNKVFTILETEVHLVGFYSIYELSYCINARYFLTTQEIIRFSKRAPLHGVVNYFMLTSGANS
jgi:hypothetical protein